MPTKENSSKKQQPYNPENGEYESYTKANDLLSKGYTRNEVADIIKNNKSIDIYDGSKNEQPKEKKVLDAKEKSEAIKNVKQLMINDKLPEGVVGQQYLGGTMNSNGKPVNMKDFKEGYFVSCGNASYEENKKYLLESDFIDKFMQYSSDGELYAGSWYEDGRNTNEPTIWVRDKETAIALAKKTGQYSITDCAMYNKYGCENYKMLPKRLTPKQFEQIFIQTANDAEHKIKLKDVEL